MSFDSINSYGPNGLSEYGENFIVFLEWFYDHHEIGEINNIDLIIEACRRMEECHEGQERKNGKPYYIHPYSVAKIYCLVHKRNISTRGIIAALIHDNKENAHKSDKVENYESIEKSFGTEDAIICEALSKEAKDTPNRNQRYFSRFNNLKSLRVFLEGLIEIRGKTFSSDDIRAMTFKTALIKICDRIHNLRTMNDFDIEKIQEKIEETEKYILPIAKELGETHPRILDFLQKAIFAAKQQVTRLQTLKAIN